jgi:hypothetical protein
MKTPRRKHLAPQCVCVTQMPRQHGDLLSNTSVRKDRQEQPVRRTRRRIKTHERILISMTTHAQNHRINPNQRTLHFSPRPSSDGYLDQIEGRVEPRLRPLCRTEILDDLRNR